jgi:hypothetical protein
MRDYDDDEEEYDTPTNGSSASVGNSFRKVTSKKTIKLYKQIITKSSLPSHHLKFVDDFYGSDNMPMGRVSLDIFEGIFKARAFDRYGKLIPNKLTEKERVIAELRAKFAQQTEAKEVESSSDANNKNNKNGEKGDADKKKASHHTLRTPVWKIGYRKPVYGPPGLAPPLSNILNSLGNERYFSYDGEWKEGAMQGGGVYKFADGMLYEGGFEKNRPHGFGKATYANGSVYTGAWVAGSIQGVGTCEYSVGTTYHGAWKEGKRHGAGKLTYPTGSYYEGNFLRGRFNGRGEHVSKDTGIRYKGGFENGFLAGTGTVYFPNGEEEMILWPKIPGLSMRMGLKIIEEHKVNKSNAAKSLYAQLYAPLRTEELNQYVAEVRQDISEERAAMKEAAGSEKRRLQKEAKEKDRERRLQSLLDAEGNAIEGAEEEVKMLLEEKEELKKMKARAEVAEAKAQTEELF